MLTEWAFAFLSSDKTHYETSKCKGGFKTEKEAIADAQKLIGCGK
jgi:hypothetical protein